MNQHIAQQFRWPSGLRRWFQAPLSSEAQVRTLSGILDDLAERLRRWTANPLGSARVGSNPTVIVNVVGPDVKMESNSSLGLVVRIHDCLSCGRGSIPRGNVVVGPDLKMESKKQCGARSNNRKDIGSKSITANRLGSDVK